MSKPVHSSTSDQLKRDQKLVQGIKPKLRKFVIDEQVKNAEKVSKQKQDEADQLLKGEEVSIRARTLSYVAFHEKRLWLEYPPSVEMKWLTEGADTADLQVERLHDIAGFATYLIREYYHNYLKQGNSKRGYLNPMDEHNLLFFWQKFNADLRLLIDTDNRLKTLGNAGVVLVRDPMKKGN